MHSAGVRPHTVLVTDPEQRASLAAARSLSRSGFRVVTIGQSKGLAGRSRSTAAHVFISGAEHAHAERFRQAVQAAVTRHAVTVVLPVTDRASRSLLGHDTTVGAVIAGPSVAAYERASNKVLLGTVAPEVGLRIPQFLLLESPQALSAVRPSLAFPLVCKPQQSVVTGADGALGLTAVRFVERAQDLDSVIAAYPTAAYPLMLQQRVPGLGVGVFLLRTEGRTLLQFGHRRLREKPPAGGVSTYREAMVPPAALLQQCEALLDRIGFSGAAMIEFKHDEATDAYYLIEINARLWGSVQLAIDSGLDFPTALVRFALGEPMAASAAEAATLSPVRVYWELGELDHALTIARRSAEALHLPGGTPTGVGAAVRALLDRRWLRDRPEVFRASDPLPFLFEIGRWLHGV